MGWQISPYCKGKGRIKKKQCLSCGGSGKYLVREPERGLHKVDWESR